MHFSDRITSALHKVGRAHTGALKEEGFSLGIQRVQLLDTGFTFTTAWADIGIIISRD